MADNIKLTTMIYEADSGSSFSFVLDSLIREAYDSGYSYVHSVSYKGLYISITKEDYEVCDYSIEKLYKHLYNKYKNSI